MKDKYADIEQLLKVLNDSGWRDALSVKELHTYIHKLSGSAGSYGFGALSDSAMDIDLSLKNRIAGNGHDQDIERKIKQLLEDMKSIYQS